MVSIERLLRDAHEAGLYVRRDGGRLVVRGPRSAHTVAQRLLDRKTEVLAALAEREAAENKTSEPIDWWERISAEDEAYLTVPHRWPEPCVWCGGRLRHNPLCVDLTRDRGGGYGVYW